jgi:CoA:oxalate CoA-transferase
MAGPLQGIKILDFTHALAGAYATMLLGDLGADVIKIEPPTGDVARAQGPKLGDVSTYFFSINRGKKSVIIDLKTEKGKELVLKLVKLVDVVTENFTPGTMGKLGLSYDVLKKHNPRIIYAALSGFGQTGPYRDKPALDIVVQAMGGLMSMTGPENGAPVRAGLSIGDIGGGTFLAVGILSAYIECQKNGVGQMLDLSMLDCQVALLENAYVRYFATGEIARPKGSRHQVAAIHQAFPTKDGNIAFTVGGLEQWTVFLELIGRLDILSETKYHNRYSRAQNMDELEPIIIEALSMGTTEEWVKKFEAVGMPCGPINNIAQAAIDPQITYRKMFATLPCPPAKDGVLKVSNSPFKYSRTSPEVNKAAPDVGEHTEEVMSSVLGLDQQTIASLKAQKIITRKETPL